MDGMAQWFGREEKISLLKIARDAIEYYLAHQSLMPEEAIRQMAGGLDCQLTRNCFVTIHLEGRLRGCMGTVHSDSPLFLSVAKAAVNAGFHDPRFRPLDEAEWARCDMEISVLSEFVRVDSPDEIEVGRDGIILESGAQRGLLLPQVAVKYGWDAKEFVRQTYLKAGMDPFDSSEKPAMFRFEADIFSEKDFPDVFPHNARIQPA